MRKILVIFAVLVLALIVGCAKVDRQEQTTDKTTTATQSIDTGSSASISETDSIEEIADAEGEKELDNIDSTLDSW